MDVSCQVCFVFSLGVFVVVLGLRLFKVVKHVRIVDSKEIADEIGLFRINELARIRPINGSVNLEQFAKEV